MPADASPPTFEDAWQEFIDALKRARGRSEPESNGGLTLAQYHLLEPLRDGDQLRVGALAEQAGVSRPVATRMVGRLGDRGFVVRKSDADDARAIRVCLTPAGLRAVATMRSYVESRRRELAGALDPGERDQAAVLLGRLAKVIDEL